MEQGHLSPFPFQASAEALSQSHQESRDHHCPSPPTVPQVSLVPRAFLFPFQAPVVALLLFPALQPPVHVCVFFPRPFSASLTFRSVAARPPPDQQEQLPSQVELPLCP
jgi:hypothetical protein